MPQKWTISPDATLNVPVMKRTAIPMAELAVRPDVRASEMTLASAFYSTASARAAFYPSLNNFEYAIMSASADISDAMTVYEKSMQKQQWLTLQVENLTKAVEVTNELLLFDGSTTYLEVLTAQKNLLGAQTAQITTNLAAAQSVINLYQNLGGGR